MVTKKHLIIGTGPAALSALEQLRRLAPEDEVKLVTMEDCLPYSPASLPYLLSGQIKETDLWLKDESYFKGLNSTLVRGREVVQVLPEVKRVVYRDGGFDRYDDLLIASGAEPVELPNDGLSHVEAHTLRTLADCRRLLHDLQGKKKIAIMGAGLVGMKIAAALPERGYQVSIIEKEPAILPLYFNEEAEKYIREAFVDHKASLLTGKQIGTGKKKKGKIQIDFSDGSSADTDVLVNAAGVKSRMPFLEKTSIKTNKGILVDNGMRTSAGGVYAAGDVAEAADFFTGKAGVFATIPSAVTQGRVAGANMAGQSTQYEGGIAMTALNFFGHKAFSIGLIDHQATTQILRQQNESQKSFRKLVFEGDRLVGAMLVNDTVDAGMAFYLIKNRIDISPYKDALFNRVKSLSDPWLRSLKFQASTA